MVRFARYIGKQQFGFLLMNGIHLVTKAKSDMRTRRCQSPTRLCYASERASVRPVYFLIFRLKKSVLLVEMEIACKYSDKTRNLFDCFKSLRGDFFLLQTHQQHTV